MILTLLFTDVADAAEEARRAHLAMVRLALKDHEGAELVNLGDGVLVTFHSATAGVLAAVAIQQAAASRPAGPIPSRVAIHVGEAGDEAVGLSAATAVVARLCAQAAPGEVLATGVVAALAASRLEMSFTERAVADSALGSAGGAHALEWGPAAVARPTADPFVAARPGDVFVGRTAELQRLTDVWSTVRTGAAGVAVLAGEPGIGKTALAREFVRQAHDGGALVLHGGCDEDLEAPYQPFIEAIRAYAAGHVDEVARLGASAGRLARIVPELASLIPDLDQRQTADTEVELLLLFEAVVDLLTGAARERPVVLVLDDLQWAARPTLLLLGHVCRSRLPSLLLVLCYRNTELGDAPGLWELLSDLHRLAPVTTVTLGGLDEADVVAYIDATAAPDAEVVADLGRAVFARTEGNPLFVREVLAHLREQPAGARGPSPVSEIDLPAEVRDVIDRRLYRISAGARDALAAGAVAGPSFSFSVLEHVPEVSDDPEVLVASLEEAAAAGLVREVVGDRFRFSHALVRETLYSGLTTLRRLRLHRSVAHALEAIPGPPDTERLTELAHHYTVASPLGCAEEAVRYLRSAAERAREALALDTTVAYYEQALELVAGISDVDQRRRMELELRLWLGATMSAAYGLGDDRITAAYSRAEELAHEVGDAGERFRALQGVFSYWVGRPDHARAAPLGDALVALADEVGNPAMAFSARAWRGATMYMAGDRARAAGDFAVALEIYDPTRSPLDMLDPGLTAMVFNALVDWDLGHEDSALQQAAAAREIVRNRHPFTVAYVNAHVAKLHARRGDAAAAAAFAAEAGAVAAEHGLRQLVHQAGWVVGWAMAMAGDPEAGAAEIEAAIDGLERSSSMADASHALVVLAEVRQSLGQAAAALEVAMRAEDFMTATGERAHEAEMHRLIGELQAVSDPAAAEERLLRAVEVARAQGVVPYEQRAAQSLALLREGPASSPK